MVDVTTTLAWAEDFVSASERLMMEGKKLGSFTELSVVLSESSGINAPERHSELAGQVCGEPGC